MLAGIDLDILVCLEFFKLIYLNYILKYTCTRSIKGTYEAPGCIEGVDKLTCRSEIQERRKNQKKNTPQVVLAREALVGYRESDKVAI